MNYKKLMTEFANRLHYEINQTADPTFLTFLCTRMQNGQVSDDDLTEMKGYRKGLKVSREILQRILCEASEECGDLGLGCQGCPFIKICTAMGIKVDEE